MARAAERALRTGAREGATTRPICAKRQPDGASQATLNSSHGRRSHLHVGTRFADTVSGNGNNPARLAASPRARRWPRHPRGPITLTKIVGPAVISEPTPSHCEWTAPSIPPTIETTTSGFSQGTSVTTNTRVPSSRDFAVVRRTIRRVATDRFPKVLDQPFGRNRSN